MPSDRARVTYDPTRKWRGLIAQQGRVTVESDWNEAASIDAERDRQITLDFVGPVGTPAIPTPGYVVTLVPQTGGAPESIPGDLVIGAGTLYVGGERLDLDRPVVYSIQPEWLDSSTSPLWVPPGVQAAGVNELVYLLATEQEVSAVEDPALADVALGGPDTMQRLRIIQRFVRQTVTPNVSSPEREPLPFPLPGPIGPFPHRRIAQPAWWTELVSAAPAGTFSGLVLDDVAMTLRSTSTLQVAFQAGPAANGAGQLGAATGYLGAENQLIRVMVASTGGSAGPDVVWGFDDASFLYRVQAEHDSSTNQVILTLASPPVDSYHYPAAGQVVELLRDEVWLAGQDYVASPTGFVATVRQGYDATTSTLVIGGTAVDGSSLPTDYLPQGPVSAPSGPEITLLTPSAGAAAGGTLVTVTGSGFTGATAVDFGSTAAGSLLVQSDTQLTVITPPVSGTTPVSVPVTVITPLGTSAASSFNYITPGAPVVNAVSPTSGVLTGGSVVTLQGSGFTGATGVNFGADPGLGLTVLSDETLTVISPAAPAGQVTVTVVTPQGTASGQFTYAADPPPQVTAISPTSGGLAGGTVVSVSGSAFTGATEVDFGTGNPGTGLSVLSDTELIVVSPAAPPPGTGTVVDVIVTTAAGTSPVTAADKFTYQLEVSGVSPAIGPPSGGTVVTIAGSGFTGATAVAFGDVPGTDLTVQSDTQLTVTTPPGGGTVDVIVQAPGGASPKGAVQFAYEKTPQLYARVWQAMANPAGRAPSSSAGPHVYSLDGTGVTVSLASGNGQFRAGDFWRFAVRPLQSTAVYPARYLAAPQPPDGPRTWICPLAMLVWNADGTASVTNSVPPFWNLVTMTNAILSHVQLPVPVVTSVSPSAGPPSGGTAVTVKGTGFTGATTVYFGPTTNPGTSLSVLSDTELTVTSPAGSGIVDLRVITAGGESAAATADQFAYIGVTEVTPAVGPPSGGTVVTIAGSGFNQATAVDFGPNPGTALDVVSDSEITVTSPAGSGLVDVTVTTASHTSQPAFTDRFAYVGVTGAAPTAGPQTGGTQVTVTGAGFAALAITAISFGPFSTTNFTVLSDTTISVVTPPGSGNVMVTVTTALGRTATGPTFSYQGKNILKDSKDVRDHKSIIIDKVTDKIADKRADKTVEKITEKFGEKAADLALAARPSSQAAKRAEAKPPETVRGPAPTEPAPVAGELPAPGDNSEEDQEQGRAFIQPEERPEVGGDIVADEGEQEGQ